MCPGALKGYYYGMQLSLPKALKALVLAAAALVLGLIVYGSVFASTLKDVVMNNLGMRATGALSANSCQMPASQKSNGVYFVSCGGFF